MKNNLRCGLYNLSNKFKKQIAFQNMNVLDLQ